MSGSDHDPDEHVEEMSGVMAPRPVTVKDASMSNRSSSVSPSAAVQVNDDRDEEQEVRNMTRKDTSVVRWTRLAVTGALLVTALAITLTTFQHLKDAETDDFQTAYDQFSLTLSVSATEQQRGVSETYKELADTISAAAIAANATWPFFSLPRFEQYGYHTLRISNTEILGVIHVVKEKDVDAWNNYTNETAIDNVYESYEIATKRGNFNRTLYPVGFKPYIATVTSYSRTRDGELSLVFGKAPPKAVYYPHWSFSPPPYSLNLINIDLVQDFDEEDKWQKFIDAMVYLKYEMLIAWVEPYLAQGGLSPAEHAAMHSKLPDSSVEHPHSFVYVPVHVDPDDRDSEIVALLYGGLAWDASLQDLLPEGVTGIHTIIRNTCGQAYTYEVDGPEAVFVGNGDLHETKYDNFERIVQLSPHSHPEFETVDGHCIYTMHIYPTSKFEDSYDTNTPEVFAIIVACTFFLVIVVFFVYDMAVQKRNDKLIERAARSNAIVASIFPTNIRDQLIGQDAPVRGNPVRRSSRSLRTAMTEGVSTDAGNSKSKPMADLFLDTTIMFADIVGFTAWSSTREPSQVFRLLESLYGKFDDIAKVRRVFKVETVGDCYVAATGMPEPRKDHASGMCRFARDILNKMHTVVKDLEVLLGPDTGDLDLRIGIHSGPVTAGVLRGERARFQLFGDTMNTTARIESSGQPGKIHLSQETARILIDDGKEHWIEKRQEMVTAKGKGQMQTYWLTNTFNRKDAPSDGQASDLDLVQDAFVADEEEEQGLRSQRRVDWLVECFVDILRQMVALRNAKKAVAASRNLVVDTEKMIDEERALGIADTFLEEVQEIIRLPEFDSEAAKLQEDPDTVEIPDVVVEQLRHYVTTVSNMYRANDFHNFEHASHVTMSVLKLLSRIVAPSDLDVELDDGGALHDHTYGITSDPLTQFACALSALIHDVDHSGVPNAQLIKENSPMASLYKNRSVAEQNSLSLSWDLLMDDQFDDLRAMIYTDENELRRFRQLVVNSVMATDIVDKDLKKLRNARWEKAFAEKDEAEDPRDAVNRKATIVIEHLIQASDVSHTMQHWHVYRKWNERFFLECYKGFRDGRAEKDPSEGWYKGEIGFFDFYIIPLAKKLKDCGVFGKSSDEYLNYAMKNREEWEARGQEVVAEMIEKVKAIYGE